MLAVASALSAAAAGAAPGEAASYLGAARCIDCHTQPGPARQQDGTTDWVRLTEAHTWLASDKHSQAFQTLATDYSKKLGERLGIDDVTKDQRCLSCHAGWTKGSPQPPRMDMGVSCEACHGPSSLYDLPHAQPDWRARPADEKADLGMVDVRHPRARSEQCLACHLGNAAEGKLLTHAMYAAGHPPLPGFEPATFARVMPAHWRELPQKPEIVSENAQIRQAVGYHDHDLPEVKAAVIGGVVVLRESVRLSGAWAMAESVGWPDFAQYDCSACHHELERPSWRQARRLAGRPGRLLAPQWPALLAEVGMKHLERGDATAAKRLRRDFEQQWTGYLAAGSNERNTCCEKLSETLDVLLQRLDDLCYDEAAGEHLLRDVCELGQRPDLDFDSARQLGWAFRSIWQATYGEAADRQPAPRILGELSDVLSLDLPSTRQEKILGLERQQALFDILGDYQPIAVNARFAILLKVLGE